MTRDAIVFDLDGTLIDSLPDVHVNLTKVFEKRRMGSLSLDQTKVLVGGGARKMVENALKLLHGPSDEKIVDDLVDEFLASYAGDPAVHTVIYEGVLDVLDRFASEGVTMGICTNKPAAVTHCVLEALELNRYFRAVCCGDRVTYQKPDGRHLLQTLEMMDAEPLGAVMVGDSAPDILAGRNAGVATVAVAYGYCQGDPGQLGADMVIEGFHELPRALLAMQRRQVSNILQ